MVVPSPVPKVVIKEISMKTEQHEDNSARTLRKIFRRHVRRHDPLLVLTMSIFNFTDGWRRTFSKYEYAVPGLTNSCQAERQGML